MASKYDQFWQSRLGDVLSLFDEARQTGQSTPLDVADIASLGKRNSWRGKVEIVHGQAPYSTISPMASLGTILESNLPEWAAQLAWVVSVNESRQLTVQRIDPRETNWFETAYRMAKRTETIERAAAHLGPLTSPEGSSATIFVTQSGTPVYLLFSSQSDNWFSPQQDRLEAAADEDGSVVLSATDETTEMFDLWIVPARKLLEAIQRTSRAPTLAGGSKYGLNVDTDAERDIIRQLAWDIRAYRVESGPTELTREKFWPAIELQLSRLSRPGSGPLSKDEVITRLQQWKVEATDPNHPNYYHADLDYCVPIYQQVSELVRKLRANPEVFTTEDVTNLFGVLNSGKRMKNKVARENPLPELRNALLEFLDGNGRPSDKLQKAAQSIRYASDRMLGELYGWAHAETAPLYNDCATDALRYLGYNFDPRDYDAFVAAHEQFKKVYEAQIGRLREDLPLNLEIDKLYNVIHKVDLKSPSQGKRYWRITLPDRITEELPDGSTVTLSIWEPCLEHDIAAVDFHTNQDSFQVEKFKSIQPGDRVVAFLRNKLIGGIGTVTSPWDEDTFERRPSEQDHWQGQYWHRIGVDWQPHELNVDELPKAVANMFIGQTVVELTEAEFDAVAGMMDGSVSPNPPSPFDARSFELLEGLHRDPTKAYYMAHKDEFKEKVEGPFQRVFHKVAGRLPGRIRSVMETEKGIFARILKNDWGQGGAWDYYWGAFYPRGGKRIEGAQLSFWINYQHLEYGFHIGSYGSEERQRFQRNCQAHGGDLACHFQEILPESVVFFGSHHDFDISPDGSLSSKVELTWEEFLRDPSRVNDGVSIVISRQQLLQMSVEDLVARMTEAYEKLFPLVLLATEDDPMPAISRYLEGMAERIEPTEPSEPYGTARFLRTTYLTPDTLEDLREMLADKRQAIFYGPPGTGKSFVARELAKLILNDAAPPPERLEIVQFHPAYSYEDFIEGIRPKSKRLSDGRFMVDYPVQPGVFQRFCQEAQGIDGPCVFIIDEINRGNIPRIFGELMLLLEYRDLDVPLAYSGRRFHIPQNVYLIGTMNTADRSIALVDFALRRRFHFFHFAADPDLLGRWLKDNPVQVPCLSELYRRLSQEAIDDPDFAIGPSHFMVPGLTEIQLKRIWRRTIEPYLTEYHFDQRARVDKWRWNGEIVCEIRGQHDLG